MDLAFTMRCFESSFWSFAAAAASFLAADASALDGFVAATAATWTAVPCSNTRPHWHTSLCKQTGHAVSPSLRAAHLLRHLCCTLGRWFSGGKVSLTEGVGACEGLGTPAPEALHRVPHLEAYILQTVVLRILQERGGLISASSWQYCHGRPVLRPCVAVQNNDSKSSVVGTKSVSK